MLESLKAVRRHVESTSLPFPECGNYPPLKTLRASVKDDTSKAASPPSEHMLNAARAEIAKRYRAAGSSAAEAEHQARTFEAYARRIIGVA